MVFYVVTVKSLHTVRTRPHKCLKQEDVGVVCLSRPASVYETDTYVAIRRAPSF